MSELPGQSGHALPTQLRQICAIKRSQAPPVARHIAPIMNYSATDREGISRLAALRDGLQKLGWTEGATFGSTFVGPPKDQPDAGLCS